MKKIIVLFVLANIILYSCGNNEADKKALTGEWKEIPVNKYFQDLYIILKEDGTYQYSYKHKNKGETIKRIGNWEIDDGYISFIEGKDILVEYKECSVKNDTLTFGLVENEKLIRIK